VFESSLAYLLRGAIEYSANFIENYAEGSVKADILQLNRKTVSSFPFHIPFKISFNAGKNGGEKIFKFQKMENALFITQGSDRLKSCARVGG